MPENNAANPEFPSRYDVQEVEERIYKTWEESGYFNPDVCVAQGATKTDAEPFSIVLPPPNVTGTLHIGHAYEDALQDAAVRYARMCGKKTLWVPGTDHAAIATQSKVEAALVKDEGKTKYDLGREEFLKRVNEFAKNSHDTIVRQVRRMGASLDWSREAYTLDEERSLVVRTVFKRMYDLGLIYRGERIVNWDPKLQTTVSDDEIEWVEETVPLYYLKYGPFVIATARPETKFGDKYVVMHPEDKRYVNYTDGQKIELEWINGPVTATIIKDPVMDMEFGTGVMTITPWHDATDFDLAERHHLEREQIIDLQGKLLPIAGEYAGLHIKKARLALIEKLQAKGLVDKIEEKYIHRIATNSRGNGVIEPQILRQWFVDVNKKFPLPSSLNDPQGIQGIKPGEMVTLKELMQTAVKNGQVTIIPNRFEKVYFHWIDNLRDWCISRQLWFGHRLPVWYKGEEMHVGDKPDENGWEQDPDTLDTWFSSGTWTFSTMGWPEKTSDLQTYHPTSFMAPGYEIIFFWVARMILMSGCMLGEVPFRTVYLHGMVRDKQGRKFSKSLGNGVDPLVLANQYGADALRMALLIGAGPGNDIKFDEAKVRGYRNFATKIWNASRFVLMNKPDQTELCPEEKLSLARREYLAEFEKIKTEITGYLDKYDFNLAGETAYHYFWHTFADKIIEAEKAALRGEDAEEKTQAYSVLITLLKKSLKLLHPFMPFITEEIYQRICPGKMLMVEKW